MDKKSGVNFNQFFIPMAREALRRGYGKTEFMVRCGIPRQRYSEFMKAISGDGKGKPRDLSARYFLKIMEGLELKHEEAERIAGVKFTKGQIKELKIEQFTVANRDLIEALVENPDLLRSIKSIVLRERKK